jgi:hypothetical protein
MMDKDLISKFLIVPIGIGGVYMWSKRGRTRQERTWIGIIVAYDLIALATMHWWLKTF